MKDSKQHPNPAGRSGKPIMLPPSTFEDAVKKIINAPPPPKESKETKADKTKRER